MDAGEEITITIDTKFGTDNLLPSDYSFVVWAEEQPVDIEVTSHDTPSQHFPNFQMSETVQFKDLQGNIITGSGSSSGGETGGDTTPDDGGETGGDTTPDDTDVELEVPIFRASAEVDFNEKFKFAQGDNEVTSSIIADTEETFKQATEITIDGYKYNFSAEYKYSPSAGFSHTKLSFEDDVCS